MRKTTLSMLAVLSLLGPGQSLAGEEPTGALKPLGAWQLDYSEDKCRMARAFGDAAAPTILYFEQRVPSFGVYWGIAGNAVARFSASRSATIAFEPGGDTRSDIFPEMKLGEFGNVVTGVTSVVAVPLGKSDPKEMLQKLLTENPYALDAEKAANITRVRLTQKNRDPVILETGSLQAPLKAMNTCMDDLVRHWGLDPAEQRARATIPVVKNMPTIAERVQGTMPPQAARLGQNARFQLLAIIDEKGHVESCRMDAQTAADQFAELQSPCAIFKRTAVIDPATDKTGRPIKSYLSTSIWYEN